MTMIDDVSSWAVWIVPLISCLFVPLVAKYGAKARDYFVIAIAVVTAALAFSLIPGVFFGSGEATGTSIPWIAGIQECTSTRSASCSPRSSHFSG